MLIFAIIMKRFPHKLSQKMLLRDENDALRSLPDKKLGVDFSSNDYLGFSKREESRANINNLLVNFGATSLGATGSRLLTGNHSLYNEAEKRIASYHNAEAALLFNSGYDANIGFFSSVPQKGDLILYDELVHASIRDGIQLSHAKGYKFKHNDLKDLEEKLKRYTLNKSNNEIYVVTESVFSMDGDTPDLQLMANICLKYQAFFIVDEAHALGVFGNQAKGLVHQLGLTSSVFTAIYTYGKAMGCHGAAIVCSNELKNYLINFARSFIYTTGLPPHSVASIIQAYFDLEKTSQIQNLRDNIDFFVSQILKLGLQELFVKSESAIQSCIVSGNSEVKYMAGNFQKRGFDVKPILSPTVPQGQERLRFCLHSYNTQDEIMEVLKLLVTFAQKVK